MKILFILDNDQVVNTTPDKLQLREIAAGRVALGVTGKAKDAEGVEQEGFLPLVNYEGLALTKVALPAVQAEVAKRKGRVKKTPKSKVN